MVRSQLAAKQREQRLLRLTMSEVQSFASNSVVYEGVGKMYVRDAQTQSMGVAQ